MRRRRREEKKEDGWRKEGSENEMIQKERGEKMR